MKKKFTWKSILKFLLYFTPLTIINGIWYFIALYIAFFALIFLGFIEGPFYIISWLFVVLLLMLPGLIVTLIINLIQWFYVKSVKNIQDYIFMKASISSYLIPTIIFILTYFIIFNINGIL